MSAGGQQCQDSSPLFSYPPHPLRPFLLVLLLLSSLLRRVLLHALSYGLVIFGDVAKQPVQALLDGFINLLPVAQNCRARFLEWECISRDGASYFQTKQTGYLSYCCHLIKYISLTLLSALRRGSSLPLPSSFLLTWGSPELNQKPLMSPTGAETLTI